jgi:hypothetical protein
VQLPRSTICVLREVFTTTWVGAQDRCNNVWSGGQLCTYSQMRRICANGGPAPIGGAWLADRVADDTAVITNGGNCNNFDGTSGALDQTQGAMYCCIEWMKY